ncbi:MAG TPA: TlpA disulfide reductase family protein [Gemmatimonadaceae bacterium]|nr:TlpA disulfide reductase family protein [Gemmatimonadaceae bacterium]
MPRYIARTLSGDSVAIGGTGAEPVTLVNVWATWCTSCREEFADLESLQQHYAAKGLRVVAVSVDGGNGSKVARFVKDQHATFTVAHDPVGRIENAYQVVGVPSSFLVGHDGRLLWTHVGALPKDAAQAVAQALGS